MLVKLVF